MSDNPSIPDDFDKMIEIGKKSANLPLISAEKFYYYVFGKLAHLERLIECNKTWHNTVAKEENKER